MLEVHWVSNLPVIISIFICWVNYNNLSSDQQRFIKNINLLKPIHLLYNLGLRLLY